MWVLVILMSFWITECFGAMKVVHYNIRELDSTKIRSGMENAQVVAATAILRGLQPEILSLNEVQYDLPLVPNKDFQSLGENLDLFSNLIGVRGLNQSFFQPANTGREAKTLEDGTYITDPANPRSQQMADQTNFGVFPAEYSTGLLTTFPIRKKLGWSRDITWKMFRPELDLSPYRNGLGAPFNAQTIELFDKSFMVALVEIEGVEVAVILLHTVPAFNFGNAQGLNEFRNADQLRFLNWYLTGELEVGLSDKKLPLSRLPPNTPFIAMGDFNVDISNSSAPGSKILTRLSQRFTVAPPLSQMTHEESGFQPAPRSLRLDYMIFGGGLEVLSSGVARPDPQRVELGCEETQDPAPLGFVKVSYFDKSKNKNCFAFVTQAYKETKTSSDHFPIWAEFRLKSIRE